MTEGPAGVYTPRLPRLIADISARLSAAGIGHGFGGALALAYVTHAPRTTLDVDINIAVPVARAREVLEQLPPGTVWDAGNVEQIERDGQTRVQWADSTDRLDPGFPIDLFFPQAELHEEVAAAVFWVDWLGGQIPVIAGEHIVIFKVLFNRPKDWLDLEIAVTNDSLDWAMVVDRIEGLLGADSTQAKRLSRLLKKR